jgi:3-hydroxyacyl-[acyl-carrier-protein] dehydratase
MLLNNFYTIISSVQNGEQYTTNIELNAAHPIYEGHFPNNPVLPGVCMMMIVQETLVHAIGKNLQLQEAKMIKFLGVVNPNQHLQLTVECTANQLPDNIIAIKATIYTEGQVFYKAQCSFLLI